MVATAPKFQNAHGNYEEAEAIMLLDPAGNAVIQNASTDRSGTITAGHTAQPLMIANPLRRGYSLQNPSSNTGSLWITSIGTAVEDSPSMEVAPGQTYENPDTLVPTGAISIIGPTTGMKFTGREW